MYRYGSRARGLPFASLAWGLAVFIATGCLAACGGGDMMEPGDTCSVGQMLGPGDECSVGADTFEVMSDGFACLIEPDGISRQCHNKEVAKGGFWASNIEETLDWHIDSMP